VNDTERIVFCNSIRIDIVQKTYKESIGNVAKSFAVNDLRCTQLVRKLFRMSTKEEKTEGVSAAELREIARRLSVCVSEINDAAAFMDNEKIEALPLSLKTAKLRTVNLEGFVRKVVLRRTDEQNAVAEQRAKYKSIRSNRKKKD
jgi:hypothetical protein